MTASNLDRWPHVALDGVARVRLLARLVPHVTVVERLIDAPYERVWSFLEDLETSIPAFDHDVRRVTVTSRNANRLEMTVRPRLSPSMRFTCEMGDGHVVMRAERRLYVVALGARPTDDGRTRYAQFEGVPRRLGRVVARRVTRHVERDADAVKAIVEASG